MHMLWPIEKKPNFCLIVSKSSYCTVRFRDSMVLRKESQPSYIEKKMQGKWNIKKQLNYY